MSSLLELSFFWIKPIALNKWFKFDFSFSCYLNPKKKIYLKNIKNEMMYIVYLVRRSCRLRNLKSKMNRIR